MADTDPLHGARLRHERAGEHIDHIKREVEPIYERFSEVATGQHPETGGYAVMFPKAQEPPPTLAVRVGEAIYNLRAALDYIVFELARLDSGEPQDGTQFPIEDRKEVFDETRRNTYLRGVSDSHVALIEEYQPYQGCNWTGILRTLSNPDKHRALHLLLTQVDPEIEVSTGHRFTAEDLDRAPVVASNDPDAKAREPRFLGRSRHMQVDLKLVASVTFSDGPPVVETLEEMEFEVEALIQRFAAEFQATQRFSPSKG